MVPVEIANPFDAPENLIVAEVLSVVPEIESVLVAKSNTEEFVKFPFNEIAPLAFFWPVPLNVKLLYVPAATDCAELP